MGKQFILKKDGMKSYNRITDIQPLLEDEDEEKSFKHKSADIIRLVVDDPQVIDCTLELLMYDIVYRMGIDRYDEPDYIYGTRITFTKKFDKNFILRGEYRWQSEPYYPEHKYEWYKAESFIFEVKPVGLPTVLFGDANEKPLFRREVTCLFKGKPVDLTEYTSRRAVASYKKELMMKRLGI